MAETDVTIRVEGELAQRGRVEAARRGLRSLTALVHELLTEAIARPPSTPPPSTTDRRAAS